MRHFTNTLLSNKRPKTSRLPQLFLLVNNQSWRRAILRSRSHPHEITFQDGWGNTPLHAACRLNPPLDVIISLLPAAAMKNADGCTPLHIACSHKSSPEVLALLAKKGDADALTRTGKSALHYACGSFRGPSVTALRALLRLINPKTIFYKDDSGQTPLSLLHRRYSERVNVAILSNESIPDFLGEFWSKACLLLRAAYYGIYGIGEEEEEEEEYECIVHAGIGMGTCCPYQLICLALAVHPEQVRLRDGAGDLPIHIAAKKLSNPPKMMSTLIEMFPDGVKLPDGDGKLPLALALECGTTKIWREDVKILLKTFPPALESLSGMEKCFPYVLELVGREFEKRDCCLSIMYDLMKAKPDVVRGALVVKTC